MSRVFSKFASAGRRLILLAVACCTILAAEARKEAVAEADIFEMSIDENMKTPVVPQKKARAVCQAVKETAAKIAAKGFSTSVVRNGEVIEITIPCSRIFSANTAHLKPSAYDLLHNLHKYVSRRDLYKVIVAVHSDNTGDEQYCDNLTAERANTIDDYFYNIGGKEETGIVPYGLGADEPLNSNSSMQQREQNRRVEIYLVPTAEFIERCSGR